MFGGGREGKCKSTRKRDRLGNIIVVCVVHMLCDVSTCTCHVCMCEHEYESGIKHATRCKWSCRYKAK